MYSVCVTDFPCGKCRRGDGFQQQGSEKRKDEQCVEGSENKSQGEKLETHFENWEGIYQVDEAKIIIQADEMACAKVWRLLNSTEIPGKKSDWSSSVTMWSSLSQSLCLLEEFVWLDQPFTFKVKLQWWPLQFFMEMQLWRLNELVYGKQFIQGLSKLAHLLLLLLWLLVMLWFSKRWIYQEPNGG